MKSVFIGGCQRSGTTLLASIIGSSTKVLTIPEAPFKFDLINSYEKSKKINRSVFSKILRNNERFKIWNSVCVDDNDDINTIDSYFNELIYLYNKTHSTKDDYELWVDHTTENLKYSTTILKYFPNAKFINIIRDGRAASASVLPLDWGPNDIIECAKWWTESICYGLASEKFFKNRVITIKYEDLLINPKDVLKIVFSFLEINFDYSELSTDGFKLPKYTVNQHHKVGQRLDVKSISNWKSTLSDSQINLFQNKTGDLLTCLGYSKINYESIKNLSLASRLLTRLNSLFKRFVKNKISQKKRVKNSYD